MKSQAAHASFVQCVCSASQRPSRRRVTNGRRAIRGRKATTAAAATPAAATTAKPARVVQWLEPAAATDAIGVERRVVEHPEHEQAQADRADARLRARVALHDGDADRVVDAAGQGDPADARGAAGEREGVGSRPLAHLEEPLPAPRLEGVGDEEEERLRRTRAAGRRGGSASRRR